MEKNLFKVGLSLSIALLSGPEFRTSTLVLSLLSSVSMPVVSIPLQNRDGYSSLFFLKEEFGRCAGKYRARMAPACRTGAGVGYPILGSFLNRGEIP